MEQRFLSKIEKTDTCWNWTAGLFTNGYGQFNINNYPILSHRFAYELWVNPIPDGLVVRHKCDNRKCVNPNHLETGTQQDNMDDKVKRNRQSKGEKHSNAFQRAKGEQHGSSKLSEDEIKEIRILLGFDISQRKLAKIYDISQPHICAINRNKFWKHI
jgi:DNA-binding transcriptional regulator YiaG